MHLVAPSLELGDARIFRQRWPSRLSGMEVIGMMAAEIRQPRRTVVPAAWIGTLFNNCLLCRIDAGSAGPDRRRPRSANCTGWPTAATSPRACWLVLADAADRRHRDDQLDRRVGRAWARPYRACRTRRASITCCHRPSPVCIPMGDALHLDPGVRRGGVGACCSLIQLGDSLRAAYQALLSLMVLSGFIPYLYLFASAWKCGRRRGGSRFGTGHDRSDHGFERGAHGRGTECLAV